MRLTFVQEDGPERASLQGGRHTHKVIKMLNGDGYSNVPLCYDTTFRTC